MKNYREILKASRDGRLKNLNEIVLRINTHFEDKGTREHDLLMLSIDDITALNVIKEIAKGSTLEECREIAEKILKEQFYYYYIDGFRNRKANFTIVVANEAHQRAEAAKIDTAILFLNQTKVNETNNQLKLID